MQETNAVQVIFPNSCAEDAQPKLRLGLTLLHSFEYPETTRIFGDLVQSHPKCAMAYWGAAMSIWHPLWAPPDPEGLARGAALLEKAAELEKTEREAAYLQALGTFFSSADPGTHRLRAQRYEKRMEQVASLYADDSEASLFYALALLATADPRDKSYRNQYKAAALLNWVGESAPQHPGVLHYLIHSYDYPGLAHLALRSARTYAAAAPDSAHAQHMPSHIFTRLGLWDLSIASNRDSTHSAAAYTEHAGLPGHYDEGLHGMDYLVYALLQVLRDDEALAVIEEMVEIERTHPENFKVAYTYASAPARYMLERRDWLGASRLPLVREGDFPWADHGWALAIHHFARGLGAARSGDLDLARRELERLEEIFRSLPPTTLAYGREEVLSQMDSVRAWIAHGGGASDEAVRLAEAAANREDAVDKHPVTPGEVLPARELLADLLAELGAWQEASSEYRTVLERYPNRYNALVGAARAAREVGDLEREKALRERIRAQTGSRSRSSTVVDTAG